MIYKNSKETADSFKQLLKDNGIKQQFVADKLNMTKQTLQHKLNKQFITFDDISQLLDVIGYELHYEFVKKSDN